MDDGNALKKILSSKQYLLMTLNHKHTIRLPHQRYVLHCVLFLFAGVIFFVIFCLEDEVSTRNGSYSMLG